MMTFILMMILSVPMNPGIIFDFNKDSDLRNWFVVDDVVMGGRSSGSFELSPDGHGVFKGNVSLENNGGFSSIRYRFRRTSVKAFTSVVLKVKGDKKKYQFRIKSKSSDYYSYTTTFTTNGDWQDIQIPLESMVPSFRGRRLNRPNFSHDSIEEIAFLIGNKNEESFQLLLDKIELR